MQSVVKRRLDLPALLGRGARRFRKCVFWTSILAALTVGIAPASTGALAKIAPDL